ncbi:MAG TPA: hypothetical protein VEA59_01975, partial [Patescibacteria group bacterium]|nr:hypothetical protein [Patescibacteria group bacterium]
FSSLDTNGVTITYRAKVSIDNGTITNTATAQAGVPQNVPPVTDTATVNVNTVVQNGTLNIEKSVRNLTTGGGFSDQANARTGETVEYKIRVYASVTTVNNVTVRDNFPSSQLTYVQGSLLVNGQQGFSGLSGTGLVFSSISTSGIDITYRATVSAGPGSTITNTAQASSPNANSVQDTARVNVTGEVINNTTLSINKEVRNITKNTSFSKNQTAQINDQVEYRIVVRNTGSAVAQDVRVTDNATFANSGLNLSGNINATKNFTGSFSSALSFGSLQVGEQVDITYRAHVSRDGFTIQNTAAAYANNAPSVQDSAFLDVGANKGNLTIAKAVRKAYSGNSFAKTAYVQDGDTVEYQIQVSANSGTVNNVRLTENIINNFTLNFGSARLEGSVISDSFYGGTISLGNLTQGQTKTLTFFGIVRNNTTTQITITNTAQATGDNVTSVQDTATVYVAGQQPQGNRQIAVNKNVRNNTTGTSFQNSVNASTGDTVTYEITISNTGTLPLENVRLTDTWTNGINVNVNTVRVDSSSVFPSSYGSGFEVSLGSIGTGQQRRVTFDATVTIQSGTVTNTARASASSVNEVQDDALVTVQFSGTPNLVYSKSAFNDTRNADATTVAAQREDYITYTLTVRNTGNAAHNNFVVSDDLSGILPLADMVDLKGGSLNGSTISYPAVNIAQGETVTKSFRVRVKSSLAPNLSYTMVNTYGNTVRVNINTPENPGPIIAPKTGVDGHTAVAFGSLLSGAFLIIRKRNAILKSIFA